MRSIFSVGSAEVISISISLVSNCFPFISISVLAWCIDYEFDEEYNTSLLMSIALTLSINSKEEIEITLSNKREGKSVLSWDFGEEISSWITSRLLSFKFELSDKTRFLKTLSLVDFEFCLEIGCHPLFSPKINFSASWKNAWPYWVVSCTQWRSFNLSVVVLLRFIWLLCKQLKFIFIFIFISGLCLKITWFLFFFTTFWSLNWNSSSLDGKPQIFN